MGVLYKTGKNSHHIRALTPLFGNGAGAHGIGEISGVLTKIEKFDIVLMYYISIARLIPIIKLTVVYYEESERKKQVWLFSIILWNCKYVTIYSVFVIYEIKMKNPPPPPLNIFFSSNWELFVWNWEKHTFWHLEWAEIRPQNRVIESPSYT